MTAQSGLPSPTADASISADRARLDGRT
jgi:mannose-6-phosphate isomerase-like protein (cupin superfamily)